MEIRYPRGNYWIKYCTNIMESTGIYSLIFDILSFQFPQVEWRMSIYCNSNTMYIACLFGISVFFTRIFNSFIHSRFHEGKNIFCFVDIHSHGFSFILLQKEKKRETNGCLRRKDKIDKFVNCDVATGYLLLKKSEMRENTYITLK